MQGYQEYVDILLEWREAAIYWAKPVPGKGTAGEGYPSHVRGYLQVEFKTRYG